MRNVIQVFQTTLTLTPRAPYRTHTHTQTHIFTKWTNCVDSNRMNYDSRLWVANTFYRFSLFRSLLICFYYLVGLPNQTICDGLCKLSSLQLYIIIIDKFLLVLEYFDYWSCCCHAAKDIYIHLTETLHYSKWVWSILRVYFSNHWLSYFYFQMRRFSHQKFLNYVILVFPIIHSHTYESMEKSIFCYQSPSIWGIFMMENWIMENRPAHIP